MPARTTSSPSDVPTGEVHAPDLEGSLRRVTCGIRGHLDDVLVVATPA